MLKTGTTRMADAKRRNGIRPHAAFRTSYRMLSDPVKTQTRFVSFMATGILRISRWRVRGSGHGPLRNGPKLTSIRKPGRFLWWARIIGWTANRANKLQTAKLRPALALGFCALTASSCATVDPRADYQHARSLMVERSGATDVYDPEAESLVEQQVQAYLADGVTINEAVAIALLNNKGFQALFQEIGASRADVVQSGLLSNPSLTMGLQFPEGGGRSKLTAGFAQQIVDLWQIPVRKRVAEAELEQIIFSAADRAVQLTAQVKQIYYETLAAQQAEELAGENRHLVERSVALAETRFKAGEVGLVDVNLVRGNLINVQLEALAARRSREEAKNRLTRLLGLSRSSSAWSLSGTWPEPVPQAIDDVELLVVALEQRLDAAVAALRIKAAEASLEKEYRSVFPNVTIGLEAERPDQRALPGRHVLADTARASIGSGTLNAPTIQSRGERRREKSQIVDLLLGPTLDITLPIWDQNQAQIAKAGYRVRQLRAAYEDLLDTVALEVNDAVSAIRSAQELARFYEAQALPQARLSVEAAQSTYQAGEQSILTLIEAQEALITQRRAQVSVLRSAAQAQAELERAMGGPIPEKLFETDAQPENNESDGD